MAAKVWIGGDATDPYKWGVAGNWSPSGIPAAGDVVIIPAGAPEITDDLDQSGTHLDGFIVEVGFTEQLGTETEDLILSLQADEFLFAGAGTAFIQVGVYTPLTEVRPVIGRCGSGTTGIPGLQLSGDTFAGIHFSGTGTLGIGTKPGAATTELDELNVTGGGTVVIGPDVTDLAGTGAPDVTVTDANAMVTSWSDVDALEALAGTYRQASGHWTTANVHEAAVYASGDGTHTATNVDGRGTVYTNENLDTRTFTDVTIEDGGTWIDSAGKGSYTNPVEFPTGTGRCTLDFGRSKKLTIAAI